MSAAARSLATAFLSGDATTAAALLAPHACFHSPIRDYRGGERIGAVWHTVAGVVQSAGSTSIHERDDETVVFFAGTIKNQAVDGVLRILSDDDGRASDITLMLRPWPALKAGLADIRPVP